MNKPKVKTLADFRAAHDKNVIVPAKIQAALDEMAKESPEQWEYERELLSRAGLSVTDLALFREQFAGHVVETSGKNAKRVWFATKKAASAARGV